MSDLLKDAIADVKAIRETAIEIAKDSLAEAFGSQIKSLVDKRLQIIADEDETADITDIDESLEEYQIEQDLLDEDTEDIFDLDEVIEDFEDDLSNSKLEEDFDSLIDELDREYAFNQNYDQQDDIDDLLDGINEQNSRQLTSDVALLEEMLDQVQEEIEYENDADIDILQSILEKVEEEAQEEEDIFDDAEESDEDTDEEESDEDDDLLDMEDEEEEDGEEEDEDLSGMTSEDLEAIIAGVLEKLGMDNDEDDSEEEDEDVLEDDINVLEALLDEMDEDGTNYLFEEEGEDEESETLSLQDMTMDDLKDLIRSVLDEMDEDEVEELEEAILGSSKKYVRESYVPRQNSRRSFSPRTVDNTVAKNENLQLKKQLRESYQTVQKLQETLNEVSLINAKLLYTGKLFRAHNNLKEDQKITILEYFDRITRLEDVKVLYDKFNRTLNARNNQTTQKAQTSARRQGTISEAVASRPILGTTKPSDSKIIQEDTLVARLQLLAGITK